MAAKDLATYTIINNVSITADASSGTIGTMQSTAVYPIANPSGGPSCEANLLWQYDLLFVGYAQKNIFNITAHCTSATVASNTCSFPVNINPSDMQFSDTLDSATGMTFGSPGGAPLLFTSGLIANAVEPRAAISSNSIPKNVRLICRGQAGTK